MSGSGFEQMKAIKAKPFGKDKLLHSGELPHLIIERQKQSIDEHSCPWQYTEHNIRQIECGYLRDMSDRLGHGCSAPSHVAG